MADFGGLRRPDTFTEYAKRLIDQLSAWQREDAEHVSVSDLTRSAFSVHFDDSVIATENRPSSSPRRQHVRDATRTLIAGGFELY